MLTLVPRGRVGARRVQLSQGFWSKLDIAHCNHSCDVPYSHRQQSWGKVWGITTSTYLYRLAVFQCVYTTVLHTFSLQARL